MGILCECELTSTVSQDKCDSHTCTSITITAASAAPENLFEEIPDKRLWGKFRSGPRKDLPEEL